MSTIKVDLGTVGTDWTPEELEEISASAIEAALACRGVVEQRRTPAAGVACAWWCRCSREIVRGEGEVFAHARTVSVISDAAGDQVEAADVAVQLWQPFLPVGYKPDDSPVWSAEKVALDLSDGNDDPPAVVLSAARARSLAAALVYAADLIENGPRIDVR